MPNIREVNAGTDIGLRPDDRAASSTANAGRREAALYTTAAEANADTGRRVASAITDAGGVVVKWAENREVSKSAADSAKTLAGLDQKWNEAVKSADPNDPTVANKFREEVVEPTLQALRDGPITEGGQRFAEATAQRFRNHFFEKTTSDMARLAGVAARENIETLKNQLSNAALSDPTSLKTSLGLIEHSVGSMVDSSPNLGGANAAAMKIELTLDAQKAIVKAAAVGAISANPDEGLKKFSSPEYSKYISGADLKALEQRAKEVQRADRVEQNYARVQRERDKEEKSDQREDEYVQKIYSGDPKQMAELSARGIANDFNLSRPARRRMIDLLEAETKPEAPSKISNETTADLISRMRLPTGDPRRIDSLAPVYDELIAKRLNKADFKFVSEEFKNLRTPEGAALGAQQEEFIKSVKPLIDKSNPLLGKIDQSGPQQVYEFTMALRRKVDEYRRTPGKNPYDLMDPSKPDYMGGPAALSQYQKPLQQSLEDAAAKLRAGGAAPPPPSASNPPPNLRGIAGLSYSPSRKQYRDDATGTVYDASGKEVK